MTADYAAIDLVATSPADFTPTRGRLRIAPGQTDATVRVPVVDDDIDEAETETFELALDSPVNANFGEGRAVVRATGSIRDDDSPVVRVSFDQTVHAAAEGGAAAPGRGDDRPRPGTPARRPPETRRRRAAPPQPTIAHLRR